MSRHLEKTLGNGRKVLFVPQTDRNAQLLWLYARALSEKYRCEFLRVPAFGRNNDMGDGPETAEFPVVSPCFLQREVPVTRWFRKVVFEIRMHSRLKKYLRDAQYDIIVVGMDAGGVGRWVAAAGKEIGVPTLVCQEGCTWTFRWWIDTPQLRVKKLVLNSILSRVFPAAMDMHNSGEFGMARFAALWGAYTRDETIRRGLAGPESIFIVGDPRVRKLKLSPRRNSKNRTLLFLDCPAECWPRGVCDLSIFNRFRYNVIVICQRLGYRLLYKPHPLTREADSNWINEVAGRDRTTEVVRAGGPEDYFCRAGAVITFPSTSIYSILAQGLPLIQVHLAGSNFDTIYWDPVQRHGAGVTIKEAHELADALKTTESKEWLARYEELAAKAAIEVAGPLDGKTEERFLDTVDKILETWPEGQRR